MASTISTQTLKAVSTESYNGDPLFRVSNYVATVYPEALYVIDFVAAEAPEKPAIQRVFPVDPSNPTAGGMLLLAGPMTGEPQPPERSSVVEVVVATDAVHCLGDAPTRPDRRRARGRIASDGGSRAAARQDLAGPLQRIPGQKCTGFRSNAQASAARRRASTVRSTFTRRTVTPTNKGPTRLVHGRIGHRIVQQRSDQVCRFGAGGSSGVATDGLLSADCCSGRVQSMGNAAWGDGVAPGARRRLAGRRDVFRYQRPTRSAGSGAAAGSRRRGRAESDELRDVAHAGCEVLVVRGAGERCAAWDGIPLCGTNDSL